MTERSFRVRVLVGSVLWAVGLIGVLGIAAAATAHHFPQMLKVVHVVFMTVAALALMFIGVAQVRRGLLPFTELRSKLSAVRGGREASVSGSYPDEVQPLVDDLNALLAHREAMVARAQAKAGDLAHGLKTPLAVLAQEADRAAAEGHGELSKTVRQQVERMRRQIEYHLAHARAAASGAMPGAHCSVLTSAEGLARTLQRLHAERHVTIEVQVAAEHIVRAEREDLDEMLGNVLDNACKWARSRVTIASSAAEGRILITVDDDGPGLDPAMRTAVLERGVRADEAAPGFGLGLAIVRDLAELHGGSIALARSPEGGVRAELRLPAAAEPPAATPVGAGS